MRRNGPDLLRWISILLLLAAVVLFFFELVAYSRERARLPAQMTVGGVAVGGVTQTEALERLLQVYGLPVELHYGDEIILLNPSSVGFRLDSEAMFAAAELARTETDFWTGFWDFLWNRPGDPLTVPLRSEFSQVELEAALRDIAARYDTPPSAAKPVPGSSSFEPGTSGRVLDVGRAAELVADVLNRPGSRRVNLPVVASQPPRPSFATLETLLRQILDVNGFDGLATLYVADLRTGEELNLAILNGETISSEPGVAITAGSTIKIGIATAFYRYFDEPLDSETDRWIREMITLSGNDTADWLMERIDPIRGPLEVTETLRDLGLESSFLAGYFRLGAELLIRYNTPGNTREDINTRPDIYNQTTAAEIGMLTADLYRCANGGGALLAAFPGELRPSECQKVLDLLAENRIGFLIEAGVPEGTRVAHKHGWTGSPLDWIGDVGIVYTPGGDFALSMFLWDDPEMLWDPTSQLMSDMARAVYNFYNPPSVSNRSSSP